MEKRARRRHDRLTVGNAPYPKSKLPPFFDCQPNRDSADSSATSSNFSWGFMSLASLRLATGPSQCAEPLVQPCVQSSWAGRGSAERREMNRSVVNLIAVAERSECGYADVPPGSINNEIESELAAYGYAVALSDRLWVGGYRIHSPESIQFGNYKPYVPPSIFTCASSQSACVPDARDFDLEAILEMRRELPSN